MKKFDDWYCSKSNCINIPPSWTLKSYARNACGKKYALNWSIQLSSSFNVFWETFEIFCKCEFRAHGSYIVNLRVQFPSLSRSAKEHSSYRNISHLSVICFQSTNSINMKRTQSVKQQSQRPLRKPPSRTKMLTLNAFKLMPFTCFTIKLHKITCNSF
jgi:hypothetical protein